MSTGRPRRVGRKRQKRRSNWSKKRKEEEEEERGKIDHNGTESTGIELGNAHLSRTSYSRVPTIVKSESVEIRDNVRFETGI